MLMLIAALSAIQLPASINEKVELDGKTYRIVVQGKVGKVFAKSAYWKKDIATSDRMRAAFQKLTGCQLDDAVWGDNHLIGVASCPAK